MVQTWMLAKKMSVTFLQEDRIFMLELLPACMSASKAKLCCLACSTKPPLHITLQAEQRVGCPDDACSREDMPALLQPDPCKLHNVGVLMALQAGPGPYAARHRRHEGLQQSGQQRDQANAPAQQRAALGRILLHHHPRLVVLRAPHPRVCCKHSQQPWQR